MNPRYLLIPLVLVGTLNLSAQEQKIKVTRLVKSAIQFAKENGKAALLRETNVAGGRFHVTSGSDLYIFIFDPKGFALAHGFQATLVNVNRWDHKDADGKFFVREFCELAATKGSGWVDYKYPNPKTGKVESKTSYIEGFEDMVIGCGVYK